MARFKRFIAASGTHL